MDPHAKRPKLVCAPPHGPGALHVLRTPKSRVWLNTFSGEAFRRHKKKGEQKHVRMWIEDKVLESFLRRC